MPNFSSWTESREHLRPPSSADLFSSREHQSRDSFSLARAPPNTADLTSSRQHQRRRTTAGCNELAANVTPLHHLLSCPNTEPPGDFFLRRSLGFVEVGSSRRGSCGYKLWMVNLVPLAMDFYSLARATVAFFSSPRYLFPSFSILGGKFFNKCKHSAKNIRARIGPIRSKKQATVRWLKKDVADLIAAGHEANAYGRDVLGKSSSTVYVIALLASGKSSAITGTYAGQYIMQVFSKHEDEKMAEESHDSINRNHSKSHRVHHQWFLRSRTAHHNLIGTIDIPSPNFIILVFKSNISMVLSFELPFALLSLLKFSSSQIKMGPHKSSIYIIVVSWILGLLRVAINIYFLSTSFVSWLIDSSLPAVANVLINIIVFPLMAVYILAVIYLTFRKETEVTFVDPLNSSHVNIESGGSFQVDGMNRSEVAPIREDRAYIPLPD
ncbi:hypothetical protein ZIOFF_019108 [Zingiber officinale]|uniref:Uncharacterized protein n=1 Tax=Zingiber officinale TaxID=94328 RepID=A0A8J5H934_ZINOF|nr:hypothetical protein ZIOFF_019108 [Zingiber officinale]